MNNATTFPCPYCKPGSNENQIFKNERGFLNVICDCGARGPDASTPLEAVEKYSKLYSERSALVELMCRAPAAPDWFEPEMPPEPVVEHCPGVTAGEYILLSDAEKDEKNKGWEKEREQQAILDAWLAEQRRQKIIQWPSAYARMVMEANSAHP